MIPLLVSIDDEHLDNFSKVVEKLESAGLVTRQLMAQIGIVVGSCYPDKIAALSQVEGVSQIEIEREVKIAPPHAVVQ